MIILIIMPTCCLTSPVCMCTVWPTVQADLLIWSFSNTVAAEISDFSSSTEQNTALNENDAVTLNCTAIGRPTPKMTLTKGGNQLHSRPIGDVTPAKVATFTYTRDAVTCDVTGTYLCEVDNGGGNASTRGLTLLVHCEYWVSTRAITTYWFIVSTGFLQGLLQHTVSLWVLGFYKEYYNILVRCEYWVSTRTITTYWFIVSTGFLQGILQHTGSLWVLGLYKDSFNILKN